jgi:hypothetical protein
LGAGVAREIVRGRFPAQRHGDALVEVLRLAADSGQLPSEAGDKPHLLVTIPLQNLRDGLGTACWTAPAHSTPPPHGGSRAIASSRRWRWAPLPNHWTLGAAATPSPPPNPRADRPRWWLRIPRCVLPANVC